MEHWVDFKRHYLDRVLRIFTQRRSFMGSIYSLKSIFFQPPWQAFKGRAIARAFLFAALGYGVLLSGCNQPQGGTAAPTPVGQLETLVAARLTEASVQQTSQPLPTSSTATPIPTANPCATPPPTSTLTPTPTATVTPTQLPANVSGRVCFPGEAIPAMTAYFVETGSNSATELKIQENQDHYEINLPAGTYLAFAWLADFSRGGLYSHAVPCGLKSNCKDHSPLPFTLGNNETLANIDLCDWYSGPFNVPYPPGKQPEEVTGSISGGISYPGGQPALRVFAFNLDSHNWYYVNVNASRNAYTIDELPPGRYQIVAYDESGNAGGFADSNHDLIEVLVKAGERATGADIDDWDAPAGAFPPDPTSQ
jgi:hypothetical protein